MEQEELKEQEELEKQEELNVILMDAIRTSKGKNAHFIEFIITNEGANVNYRDEYGFTPLHQAAINGHPQVVQALIEKGADVNVEDNNGFTPLHQAAMYGREKLLNCF